jgi:hypothetical protein
VHRIKKYVTNYECYTLYVNSERVLFSYEQEFGFQINTSRCGYSSLTCLEDKPESSTPGGRIAN